MSDPTAYWSDPEDPQGRMHGHAKWDRERCRMYAGAYLLALSRGADVSRFDSIMRKLGAQKWQEALDYMESRILYVVQA